jgi:excisionase family DNA binding protein
MGIMDSVLHNVDQQLKNFDQQLSSVKDLLQKVLAIRLEPQVNDLLNVDEVAKLIGRSVDTIYRLTHKRQIPHSKPHGVLLFSKQEIIEWFNSHRVKTCDEINIVADVNLQASNKKRKAA